jgi:kinetochore protein Mis12/MTW1
MAASNQTTTALLTEHFRYTPLTLLDDIINTVNELVFRAVNAIEEGFGGTTAEQLGFKLDAAASKALPSDAARRDALVELKQNEIDNGIVKLESLLNATVDKDFDKFEIYTLRNILAVGHDEEDLANWVRLDHYQGVDVADAEHVPTPEQVQLQRKKLNETAKLNTMLKAEEAKNAAILSQLTSLIGAEANHQEGDETASPFAFLHSSAQTANAKQLTQDAQYAVNQIPALRRLLAQLKDAMQTIPSTRQMRTDDEDSIEGRRRRYLHNQSRRALERKGIDAEASAGASMAGGRKMGRDEVEGIEAVAQALAGAETGRPGGV